MSLGQRLVNQNIVLYGTVMGPQPEISSLSRREARRQDRRDIIMDVAQTSFMNHGYAGTTMSGIAAALGGSKGTLWNHFSSKEELFEAVVDRATKAYRAQLAEILASPGDDLRTTLIRAMRSILNKVLSPGAIALHRLIAAEAERFPEIGRIFYERAPKQTRSILARFIEEAMASGQLLRDDPEAAAGALLSLGIGKSQQKRLVGLMDLPAPELIEADADFAVSLFLRAYMVPAEDHPRQ